MADNAPRSSEGTHVMVDCCSAIHKSVQCLLWKSVERIAPGEVMSGMVWGVRGVVSCHAKKKKMFEGNSFDVSQLRRSYFFTLFSSHIHQPKKKSSF